MIPPSYLYLTGTLISLVPVIFVYVTRKDLRKGIFQASLLYVPVGLFCNYFFFLQDWWHPITITHTKMGIEDVLLSISNGGFAFILYPTFFKKQDTISKTLHIVKSSGILILNLILLSILFWGFHLTSFYATTTCFIVTLLVSYVLQPKIIFPTLFTGCVMIAAYIPIYLFLIFVYPGFVANTWYLSKLSGILLIGIPLEDIIFYSLGGMYASAVLFYPIIQTKKASRQ